MRSTPLLEEHIPRLAEIRADYVSDRCARVCRREAGPQVAFALQVEHLPTPFRSQGLSIIRRRDQEEVRDRMGSESLQLVVWNLLVDQEYRRQGLGTELMQRADQFGIDRHCRALSVETQATNWPALAFYIKMGFEVCGVDDHYYTNRDLERKEVALFLYRELP
jgi:ribosomal protein S18 acetylase RimI-like enzyme